MNLNTTSLAFVAVCTLISGCSSSNTLPTNDAELPVNPGTSQNNGILIEDPVTSDTPDTPDAPGSTMLTPIAEAGSDTDRLLQGINRQIARTILDLNTRLSEGVSLTEQQDSCLGSYDPAAGQQLLAINCEQALATGDVPIYVEQASYYDTPECNAAIFNGDVSNCQLETARISIPSQWIVPERTADTPADVSILPQPVAGVEIFYAVNSTYLRIESTEGALTGAFQCDLNLLNNETSTPVASQSCASSIELAASLFDALLEQ